MSDLVQFAGRGDKKILNQCEEFLTGLFLDLIVGISTSKVAFQLIESELWKDFLNPAAAKGLVSGEVYEGLFENLNTMDDVERLDASLGEE